MKAIFAKFMALFIIFSFVFVATPVLAAVSSYNAYGSGTMILTIASTSPTTFEFEGTLEETNIPRATLIPSATLLRGPLFLSASIFRTPPGTNQFRIRPRYTKVTYFGDITYRAEGGTLDGPGATDDVVICTQGDGTLTITDPTDGSTMVMKIAGQGCTLGAAMGLEEELSPHAFNGTYFIISGTGRFAESRGAGSYTFGLDDATTGDHTLSFNGTIDY